MPPAGVLEPPDGVAPEFASKNEYAAVLEEGQAY